MSSALKKDNLRIASVNVNGLRAAYKKGMAEWLEPREVDILCLQEVRAPDAIVHELLGGAGTSCTPAEAKGRAGVAIASRAEPQQTRNGIGEDYFATAGRWVEADYTVRNAAGEASQLTVASAYVHSGEAGTPKQDDKFRLPRRHGRPASGTGQTQRPRPRGGRPQRGPHGTGHQELEGQRQTCRLPAGGAAYFDRFLARISAGRMFTGAWR